MANKTYRDAEWKPVVSGPSKLSISSYTDDYARNGYNTDVRFEQGVYRLYVQAVSR